MHPVSSAGPEHDSDEMCHIFKGAKEFVFKTNAQQSQQKSLNENQN